MPEEAINIEDIIFSENENSNDETISVDDIIFEPGKTTDPASNVTDSGSESGLSGSPTWGDKISNTFNAYINPFTPTAERPLYAAGINVDEVKEKTRKKSKDYKSDKVSFEKELDKAFSDGKLFEKMIENPNKLTLQERQVEAGDFGSPEEYLLDVVKKELGGFGLFSGDRNTPEGFRSRTTGEIIGTKGDIYYPGLTNDDIETIIEQKFYEKLDLEKNNKANNTALNTKENIEKQGVNIREWQDNTRKTFISGYSGVDGEIANLVEAINNGGLDEAKRKEAYEKLTSLKGREKRSMLYDLNTGQLTKNKTENTVDLGVEETQEKYNDILGRLKPEDQLDYLRNEFERSALTLSGHNQKLDEVKQWSILRSGYEIAGDDGKGGNRRIVESSLRDLMMDTEFANFSPVPASELRRKKDETDSEYEKRKKDLLSNYETDIKALKQDDLEYTREFESLKGMYLLNDGIVDIEKPEYTYLALPKNMAAAKQSAAALIKPWTSEYHADKLLGSTNRTIIQEKGEIYDELGIKKTKNDEKQLKVSIAEGVNDGVLGMNKMLFEFSGINKGLAITGATKKFNALMKVLDGGKWVKNGKTFTDAAIKSRAAAKGIKAKDYAANLGLRSVQSAKNKFYSIGAAGLMEAGKFELFTQFDVTKGKFKPEAGEQFGFATGFGFGAMGRVIAPLSPFLQGKGLLKDIDGSIKLGSREARIGLNSKKLFQQFVTAPASFVVGSEGGELMNAIVDDMLGNKQLGNYMDHHYGDYGEVGKRLITNYFTGLGLGVGHFKGFTDFKSKAALRRTRDTALDKMRESGRLAELTEAEQNNIFSENSQNKLHKNLSDKNLQEFYKHYEIFDGMEGRLQQLYRAEGYMDPSRADELVKQDHKQFLAEEKAAGREVKLEVVNNKKLKFQQQAIDSNRKAEISKDPKSKITTIRYNAELYSPDVMPHEVHHYYTDELFGQDAVFKGEFMNTLKSIGNNVTLKRLVTEQEAKELGNEGLKGKKMTLSQSIELKKFDLSSPTNQQRIKQWELFAHIAEQMGNKNNYFDIKNSGNIDGFVGLRSLLSTLGKTTGKKLNLSTEKDVVEWFSKYAENVKKGKSVVDMFSELESVIDFEATAIRKAERLAEGRTGKDTYSSEILDLGEGRKVNDPKKLANDVQKEYEAKITEGKDKMAAYRELSDPNPRSTNYDANYPVLGKKVGPMFDIAISSWNRSVGDQFRVSLGDRGWESKRSALAMDFLSDKRGFQDIFKQYTPDKGKLMTWVVGQSRLRMQEIIERGIGKITDIRETKVGDFVEFERIFEDVDGAGGKIDKSFDNTNPAVKPKGIQLKNHEFTFGERKRTIDPESINVIEKASKEIFDNTKLEDFTYQKVAEKMLEITTPEMTKLLGGKEGMKPKDLYNAQMSFIKENAPILYDAIPLTSHAKFYENTMIGKSILNKFYKNTGKKYITDELSVEEAARTNARTFKYEKLPTSEKRIQELVDLVDSGRDAGTKNKKANILKEHIGKVLGNQVFRDVVNNPKFKEGLNPEGLAKLEGLKAELAMRKLRGATPEKLASEDLDVMNRFIKDVKGFDYAKELFPGFHVRNMIENTKEYKQLLEKTGGVDSFLKEMGYELKGIDLKTFQKYAEANRLLNNLTVKDVTPIIFDGGYKGQKGKKGVHEAIYEFAKENNIPEELLNLNIDAAKRMADPKFSKNFAEKFLPEFYNTFDSRLIKELDMMLRKTMGEGDQRFGHRELVDWISSKTGELKGKRRKIFDAKMGKEIISKLDGVKDNIGFDPKYVRVNVNGTTKTKLNKLLDKDVPVTPEQKVEFANKVKKMLSPDNTVKGYDKMVKANEGMLEYFASKVYDYIKNAKTVEQKAEAINNISYMFQIQTNLGNGVFRGLASHTTVSIRKGNKHSEHDLQLANYTGNILMSALKNSGSKPAFTNKVKQLTKSYKQSLIDKEIQEKFDSPEYGGKAGFDFKFTTKSGKYPWLREKMLAETTLDLTTGKTYDQLLTDVIGGAKNLKLLEARKNKMLKQVGVDAKKMSPTEKVLAMKTVDDALTLGRKRKKKARGMSTFDFDETLIDKGENFIIAREPNTGKKVRISSGNWPIEGPKFAEQGYTFDFKDFVKVRGGVEGPLFKKFKERLEKFGPDNMFVLTARPPEAATAIYGWLKSKGVEIPFENITGLGNSTGEAKAMWMLKKFSEGYNDMYFVDDAMPNVKAVRNVLNQLDIKSKVQQALASENLDISVNKIMEHSLDIGSEKVFSKAEAKVRGKDIKRRRVFMRDSAADLELLIEPLYGKGKEGIKNKEWFKKEFVMPFERGTRDYNTARQSAKNDYMSLRKQNKDVVKEISKPVEGTAFTNDMAMRVYLWNKAGYKIPDLAKTTEAKLVQHIASNPKLQAYAEQFARITKQEKGLKEPGENWWGETIAGEVTNINRGVSRKQYLQEWIDVKNEIFTEENLNKMESKLGTEWRENITDMFDRMETGRTRSLKMDRGSAAMMNYLNGGIGTIMNFNTRSAVLQTISTTNFLNMRENNPIAAARAMGNVKQFAKDFKYIMNSDMLKQRRDGLAMNVTEAEIASAAASSQNPVQSIISKVLKAGYLPTKMADSFAISFGGATFYRNRIKMYEKQGMKTKEAEKQAFLDFQVIAERTQQSSRADLLSKQQTSLIGRFILPFANTPMQMNRAGMKDILDISKGRYKNSAEVAEKVGRISYYMGAQVAIFAGLQSALFAMLLNDDDVSDEKVANTKSMMLNTTADSMLRGFGVQGAVMSATKNALQEYFKQSAKPGFTADYSEVAEDLLNISPPIGSKFGMLDRAGDRKKWAKIRKNDEFKFELGNPSLEASLMTVQAVTNAPVYSPYQNLFNMQHALSDQYETWQRVLMGAGWTPYSVGVETEDKKKKKKKTSRRGKIRTGIIR